MSKNNNIFKDILKGKVVFVGIGNTLRGDDGFGPELIEELSGKIDAVCLNAGSTPENYIEKIARLKPKTILIIDAVDLDLNPGEYKILKKPDIIKSGFTTHDISPSLFIEYLEKETDTNIYMLGIQPEDISFGEEMSDNIKKTLKKISGLIVDSF
jgi:hydrogenase 3 maturation protease